VLLSEFCLTWHLQKNRNHSPSDQASHPIPEGSNLQQHCCKNLRSHAIRYWSLSSMLSSYTAGLSDVPGEAMVKSYCPKCMDVYTPKSSRHHHTDGAYFGTGFPQMLFMVHPEYRPKRPANQFVPRLVQTLFQLYVSEHSLHWHWMYSFLFHRQVAGVCEFCHWAPCSAEVKTKWSYTTPPPICLHSMDSDNF